MADFRIGINELKKIDILKEFGYYKDRTEFFNESIKYGKTICEKELKDIENFKKINQL